MEEHKYTQTQTHTRHEWSGGDTFNYGNTYGIRSELLDIIRFIFRAKKTSRPQFSSKNK